MSVGPSMPTPIVSRIPGTPAAAISWLTITCSIAPRPCPRVLARPRHAREPGLGEAALPAAARVDVRGVVVAAARGRRVGAVLVEPRAHLLAIRGLLRGVPEVHVPPRRLTDQSVEHPTSRSATG